jgi:Cys-rich protein (TIGR01571 family)
MSPPKLEAAEEEVDLVSGLDELVDDMVEIDEDELAALQHSSLTRVNVPTARGWSSATFACHRHVSSCLLSCCCPCVQFGLNQRSAFGASCFKWSLLWFTPLVALYLVLDHLFPSRTTAEQLVQHVEFDVRTQVEGTSTALAISGMDRSAAFFYACPLAMCLIGLVGMLRRLALRQKYGIGGSVLADFACHCCCWCCSLAKEAREIRRQKLDEAVAGAERDLTSAA